MPRKRGTRGQGRVFKKTYRDKKTERMVEVDTYTIAYYVDGREVRESTGTSDHARAVELLNERIRAINRGEPVGSDVQGTRWEDLAKLIVDDYKLKGHKSLYELEAVRIPRLTDYFGGMKAAAITSRALREYQTKRKEEGAANSTINRELAAVRRAFRLGERDGMVSVVPRFEALPENNARQGFFEEEQLELMLRYIHPDLANLLEIAYITGWRLESELLTRKWHHVTDAALRLEPGEAKDAKEGREFPLTIQRLKDAFARQRKLVDKVERETGRIIPWVFIWTEDNHRGHHIASIHAHWNEARHKSGVDRIPHDFRRTAVRNLVMLGVARHVAMKMVGHKTEEMFRRYAITDPVILQQGAAALDAHFKELAKKSKKVLHMKRKPA